MMKNARQKQILNIIEAYEVETQEELCSKLQSAGYVVTQATISRDIRELQLTKIVGANGRPKYASLSSAGNTESDRKRHLRIIKEAVRSADTAGNILVIKTNPGMAPAVGAAIDSMGLPEVVGCIAGDDTIMCAVKKPEDAESIIDKIDLPRV